jgi:hypothetical protein
MNKPIVLASVVAVVLALVTLGLVLRSAMTTYDHLCEVCVTYQGRSQCREAYGSSRQEAVKTATDNACSFLASGMTASVQCSNVQPDRVTCEP